ncbi:gluconokinase [Deinococcus sp. KNUC1210]|uniref:gluconokinase n=1 Tax=Deinococcus sp. KNUC1210 TaxID=2917691 RepID=UPI001EF0FAE5|nr:gluconokinase [Deinococcus sp. KNUC1210]ULH15042.1 gluconokinase [Deinococcus sp. KNUC1210]
MNAVIVMGVSGSGKSTVGQRTAERLDWPFLDADDFHTPEARAKMARGEGLNDADRLPWLARLKAELDARPAGVVLACSALKRHYRDVLAGPGVQFVYLRVPRSLLETRLTARQQHYAGLSLLPSQLAALEEPAPDEGALTLDVQPEDTAGDLAQRALEHLNG